MEFGRSLEFVCGPGNVVGIATGYGLNGPGIESRWGRYFPHLSRPALDLLYNGYRVFPGGKERPGRDANPSSLLVPWSRKGRAIPLLPPWSVRPLQSLSIVFITVYAKQNYPYQELNLCHPVGILPGISFLSSTVALSNHGRNTL
jgi:hypothetical protein